MPAMRRWMANIQSTAIPISPGTTLVKSAQTVGRSKRTVLRANVSILKQIAVWVTETEMEMVTNPDVSGWVLQRL